LNYILVTEKERTIIANGMKKLVRMFKF